MFIKNLPPKKGIVALSGGADSVALVWILHQLDVDFEIAHLDHSIRAEGEKERIFCETLSKKVQKTFHNEKLITPPKNEDEARKKRYEFLENTRKKATAQWIATAHHKNDQAETFLLRAIRGAGVQGLGAMREWNNFIWRPLLPYTKEELIQFLQSLNEEWIEDQSNKESTFTRNFIRNEIFPPLQQKCPEMIENFTQSATFCAEAAEYLQTEAASFINVFPQIPVKKFLSIHSLLQREILSAKLPRVRGKEIEEILKMIRGKKGNVQRKIEGITVQVLNGEILFNDTSSPLASVE